MPASARIPATDGAMASAGAQTSSAGAPDQEPPASGPPAASPAPEARAAGAPARKDAAPFEQLVPPAERAHIWASADGHFWCSLCLAPLQRDTIQQHLDGEAHRTASRKPVLPGEPGAAPGAARARPGAAPSTLAAAPGPAGSAQAPGGESRVPYCDVCGVYVPGRPEAEAMQRHTEGKRHQRALRESGGAGTGDAPAPRAPATPQATPDASAARQPSGAPDAPPRPAISQTWLRAAVEGAAGGKARRVLACVLCGVPVAQTALANRSEAGGALRATEVAQVRAHAGQPEHRAACVRAVEERIDAMVVPGAARARHPSGKTFERVQGDTDLMFEYYARRRAADDDAAPQPWSRARCVACGVIVDRTDLDAHKATPRHALHAMDPRIAALLDEYYSVAGTTGPLPCCAAGVCTAKPKRGSAKGQRQQQQQQRQAAGAGQKRRRGDETGAEDEGEGEEVARKRARAEPEGAASGAVVVSQSVRAPPAVSAGHAAWAVARLEQQVLALRSWSGALAARLAAAEAGFGRRVAALEEGDRRARQAAREAAAPVQVTIRVDGAAEAGGGRRGVAAAAEGGAGGGEEKQE
ncbi:unnamed protein product [Pedinophyceae sp. YPF-701]|nr:unnamed protein product [Pedinophyceae sp. YPF-701]